LYPLQLLFVVTAAAPAGYSGSEQRTYRI